MHQKKTWVTRKHERLPLKHTFEERMPLSLMLLLCRYVQTLGRASPSLSLSVSVSLPFIYFWLCQVLVMAWGIFAVSCTIFHCGPHFPLILARGLQSAQTQQLWCADSAVIARRLSSYGAQTQQLPRRADSVVTVHRLSSYGAQTQ